MKFLDFINLSMAIDKLNAKSFVKELNVRLTEEYQKMKQEQPDEEILKKEWGEERQQIAGLEVMLFIGANLHKIQDQISKILMNNTGKSKEEVEMMEHTEILEVLKGLFKDGVPKVLLDKLGMSGLDLKKTL